MDIESTVWRAAVMWALFFVLAVLFSAVVLKVRRHNLYPRLVIWFVIISLFLLALYFGDRALLPLTVVCFLACHYELSHVIGRVNGWVFAVSILASVPWIVAARQCDHAPWMIVPLILAVLAVLYYFRVRTAAGHWDLLILSFILGVCFSYWIHLDTYGNCRFFLFVFSVVWLFDIMSFVIGKAIGKHRPFPSISPNKTLAGYLGGFLNAILASYIFWFAVPEQSFLQVTLAGVLLSVSATAGDLFGSKIKRLYGVKDFGHILGPIGGITDRMDSLLFSMVVFFYFLQVIG